MNLTKLCRAARIVVLGYALVLGTSCETVPVTGRTELNLIPLVYMARAGYDPRAAVAFWRRFAEFNRRAASQTPVFLRTHPLDETRIQRLQGWLPEANAPYHPQ